MLCSVRVVSRCSRTGVCSVQCVLCSGAVGQVRVVFRCMLCSGAVGDLEDGVLLLWGAVSCCMFPGDPEEAQFRVQPLQSGETAAAHLGQEPGAEPNSAGGSAHSGEHYYYIDLLKLYCEALVTLVSLNAASLSGFSIYHNK